MPTYKLTAVNIGSFALGESDKVLTLFSAERGLVKAVAKGAKKPGTKIGGRADLLNVNRLVLATGRSLDIITQAESMESFPDLRKSLERLSYGLYYAELAMHFGQGLLYLEEPQSFFDELCRALRLQAASTVDPALLCLEFEMLVLDAAGLRPELNFCVYCRQALTENNVNAFDFEAGGITCESCHRKARNAKMSAGMDGSFRVAESPAFHYADLQSRSFSKHITPLVWKRLILASKAPVGVQECKDEYERPALVRQPESNAAIMATKAARRLVQSYIEYRLDRKMKALDLINAHSG